jgi:Conjugative transposon protein TcpC
VRGFRRARPSGRTATAGTWVSSPAGSAVTARLATAAVWFLVACGPLALITAVAGHRAPHSPVSEQPQAPSALAPGGFAQMYVTAYLRTGGASLGAFFPSAPQPLGTPGKRQVSGTAVIAMSEVSPGYWSIIVAADEGPSGVHYFTVPIAAGTVRGEYVAAALPAETAAPGTATEPGLGYDTTTPVTSGPLTGAVTQFLAAYLTGQGNLSRYLAPGAAVSPVTPAPYASIQAVTVYARPGSTPGTPPASPARVLAQVQATDSAGQQWPLTYALTLAQVAGQWDVTAVDAAPALQRTSTEGH